METTQERAIVLKSVPYQERHRIVTAIAENHGKVSALARNAIQSRRFGGSLELFAASIWSYRWKPGSELASLQEAELKRSYEGIRQDFDQFALASSINEIMVRIVQPNQSAPDLFRLHANTLALIEENSDQKKLLPILNAYLIKILHWNGNQPLLQNCLLCQQSLDSNMETLSFWTADAGWLCKNCSKDRFKRTSLEEQTHVLAIEAVLDAFNALRCPIRQAIQELYANEKHHQELNAFLLATLRYHVPGFDRQELKSLSFL